MMSEKVKRYDPDFDDGGFYGMMEMSDGDSVKYSDHAELVAFVATMAEDLRAALNNVIECGEWDADELHKIAEELEAEAKNQ